MPGFNIVVAEAHGIIAQTVVNFCSKVGTLFVVTIVIVSERGTLQ